MLIDYQFLFFLGDKKNAVELELLLVQRECMWCQLGGKESHSCWQAKTLISNGSQWACLLILPDFIMINRNLCDQTNSYQADYQLFFFLNKQPRVLAIKEFKCPQLHGPFFNLIDFILSQLP